MGYIAEECLGLGFKEVGDVSKRLLGLAELSRYPSSTLLPFLFWGFLITAEQ